MLKPGQTHFEFALGPDDFARAARRRGPAGSPIAAISVPRRKFPSRQDRASVCRPDKSTILIAKFNCVSHFRQLLSTFVIASICGFVLQAWAVLAAARAKWPQQLRGSASIMVVLTAVVVLALCVVVLRKRFGINRVIGTAFDLRAQDYPSRDRRVLVVLFWLKSSVIYFLAYFLFSLLLGNMSPAFWCVIEIIWLATLLAPMITREFRKSRLRPSGY